MVVVGIADSLKCALMVKICRVSDIFVARSTEISLLKYISGIFGKPHVWTCHYFMEIEAIFCQVPVKLPEMIKIQRFEMF